MTGKARVCVRLPTELVERLREYARKLSELTGEEWTLSDVIRYAVASGAVVLDADVDELERRRRCLDPDRANRELCRAWAEAMRRLVG